MSEEFLKQFTKTKYTRSEATRLMESWKRAENTIEISSELSEWFQLIDDEREERYIAATWRSRV